MATCFLTLYFEVSTGLASNTVICPRVCTLYLVIEPLSDGIKVRFATVNNRSKLYYTSANVCCFTSEIREYSYYTAREELLSRRKTSANIFCATKKNLHFTRRSEREMRFGKMNLRRFDDKRCFGIEQNASSEL